MDFGGQDVYRKEYLEDKTKFKGTNLLVFVIDIQDEDKFPIAKKYLDDLWKIIYEVNIAVESFTLRSRLIQRAVSVWINIEEGDEILAINIEKNLKSILM